MRRLTPPAGRGRRSLSSLLWVATLLTGAACATVEQPLRADLESPTGGIQECAKWFAALDQAIDHAGVGNAEAHRVAGFPYLRVNRFLASYRLQAQGDPILFAAWEQNLRLLDSRVRQYELENMSDTSWPALGVASRADAAARTDRCAGVLAARDQTDAARKTALVEQAQVPDDYAEWKRIVGLYPLVRLPFFEFAKGWQNESAGMFEQAAAGKAEAHQILRYRPQGGDVNAAAIGKIFANVKADSLGVPQFAARDIETLLAAFAPIYEVDTTGDYDRIGPLRWGAGPAPEVDIARPVAYRRLAFTRYHGRTLTQLVYLIWFPERPDSGWLDTLSGKLDGLIFRVTLDEAGHPLIFDSIHPCGCYHMFFPTARMKALPPAESGVEWAFVPRTLPVVEAPQRLVLRLTTRSHYLTDVRIENGAGASGAPYALLDDSELRLLPTATGKRSVFGPSGIVPGTQRGERLLVWPLGIDDPGAMREWGRHATALVGRRHFDDADLIERRFEMMPMPAVPAPQRASTR